MPYLKRPPSMGGIGLNKSEISLSGTLAVSGTIVMRFLTGPLCDMFGARKSFILLLLLAVPGICGIMATTEPVGFILCRFLIGLGLATFVTCQVWCSQMFTKSVVGIANATAGGWGNLGGGVTQLVMPFVMLGMLNATGNDISRSWRLCFILPLAMHLLSAIYILGGKDLPDGNYKELETSGAKQKVSGFAVAKVGFSNVNAWIMLITYGFCFGVELTMNNKAVMYFYSYHGMSPQIAGLLGSCFGLMNIVARSWGGKLSDVANNHCGMRGRIWAMWIVQSIEGFMCILMGLVTINIEAPGDAPGTITPVYVHTEGVQSTTYAFPEFQLESCGSDLMARPESGMGMLEDGTMAPLPIMDALFMVGDPNPACIRNSGTVGLTVFVMICFSLFVQMAEGLHYGIVPYISRPALGVCSGMVGAGGNMGAVIGSRYIVSAGKRTDLGFIHLGITILCTGLTMFLIYFPKEGGMLFPAGGLGGYDPQIIKPTDDMRGADQMDYSAADSAKKETVAA